MMPRIAILLEPLLTCNASSAFVGIAGRLCAMLLREDGGRAVPGMRIICGAAAAAHLAAEMPSARPYLLQPPAPLQSAFMALAEDWPARGLRGWHAIQAGSPRHEALYEAVLRSAQAAYPFDVLSYWGTNETLRRVAERMAIPVLWADHGPLRAPFPPCFCLDPEGPGGPSGSRAALASATPDAPPGLPGVALDIGAGGITAYEAALMLPEAEPECLDDLLRFTTGQSRVVLLAMQQSGGAPWRLGGWTRRSVTEAVLEAQAGPGTVFILWAPLAGGAARHGKAEMKAIHDLVAVRADVVTPGASGRGTYLACLSLATEVVCLSSAAGFEAALMGKPVRMLGQPSCAPAGAAMPGLQGRAPRIPDGALRRLLTGHAIPESRFWSLSCWRQAALALPMGAGPMAAGPVGAGNAWHPARLPTMEVQAFGRTRITGSTIWVDGIGPLPLSPSPGEGSVDAVVLEQDASGESLHVTGWGLDPAGGTALAGVLATSGTGSVWSAACTRRPDVARRHADPVRLASGFGTRIPLSQFGAAGGMTVRVFGVTPSGQCVRLLPDWEFDQASLQFMRVPDGMAALPLPA